MITRVLDVHFMTVIYALNARTTLHITRKLLHVNAIQAGVVQIDLFTLVFEILNALIVLALRQGIALVAVLTQCCGTENVSA